MSLIFRGPSAELCWYIHYIVLCVCFAKFYIWGPWTRVYENKLTILKIYSTEHNAVQLTAYLTPLRWLLWNPPMLQSMSEILLLRESPPCCCILVWWASFQVCHNQLLRSTHCGYTWHSAIVTAAGLVLVAQGRFPVRTEIKINIRFNKLNAYILSLIIEFKQKEPVFYLNFDVIRLIDNRFFNP